MYAIKQHKRSASRVVQQPKENRKLQFGVISNNMRKLPSSKWLANAFSTIQLQPKKVIDWTPDHTLSGSVTGPVSGNLYSLNFSSGYEIYDATISEEYTGTF